MYYPKLKKGISASKHFLVMILLGYLFAVSCKQQHQPMKMISKNIMVQDFYAHNDSNQFWFSSNEKIKRANEWLDAIDSTNNFGCLLYTSPSPRDGLLSRMPSSA